MAGRSTFGSTRQLPSRKWQARYTIPGSSVVVHAPTTFTTKAAATAWLSRERVRIEAEAAGDPRAAVARSTITLGEYGTTWLAQHDLRPSTRRTYTRLWRIVEADLGGVRLAALDPSTIARWRASLLPDKPSTRAHAYTLLATILNGAVSEELIPSNPARVKRGGKAPAPREAVILTPAQMESLRAALPDHLGVAVVLAGWCGLRYGEVAALRRRDVDLEGGTVTVARSVTMGHAGLAVGPPKSDAGERVVTIPPHVRPLVAEHLAEHVADDGDALVISTTSRGTEFLDNSVFHKRWRKAREAAGVPSARFHDLRHSHLTTFARAGATLRETMQRAGHSTPSAALRYQHAASERDRALAERLSTLA